MKYKIYDGKKYKFQYSDNKYITTTLMPLALKNHSLKNQKN